MYSKVLVPLDGSEVSERALAHAQSLGDAFGAKGIAGAVATFAADSEGCQGEHTHEADYP